MQLPRRRGPVSGRVLDALTRPPHHPITPVALGDRALLEDEDAQLALWVLHELSFRGFEDVDPDREWDPALIALRRDLERRFESELRVATADRLAAVPAELPVGEALLAMAADDDGPSVAAHLHRHADLDQARDYLVQRSLQQLKEADPQTFVLPRLTGAAKVALAELQYDEYGGGRPERLHQRLYAETLAAAGLDPTYGHYVEETTATSFALGNVMTLFALNRRLRGAAVGHFAVFEATSSVPSRKIAAGLERLGLPPAAAAYFLEHVEADAVHEHVAAHDVCGNLVAAEPALRQDVLFGAASCLELDSRAADDLLTRWGVHDASPQRLEVAS